MRDGEGLDRRSTSPAPIDINVLPEHADDSRSLPDREYLSHPANSALKFQVVVPVDLASRPSNSPVGTIAAICLRPRTRSSRPSNSPVGTIRFPHSTHMHQSSRPSNSPVGTMIPTPATVTTVSSRPSNSPVGTIPEPRKPLRAGAFLVRHVKEMTSLCLEMAIRLPFSKNHSQKKGSPTGTKRPGGLTLRVIT